MLYSRIENYLICAYAICLPYNVYYCEYTTNTIDRYLNNIPNIYEPGNQYYPTAPLGLYNKAVATAAAYYGSIVDLSAHNQQEFNEKNNSQPQITLYIKES